MPKRQPKLRGIIVPIASPFTPQGEIDPEATARIVSRVVDHGLIPFVLGTTGEAASIPHRERAALVHAAVAGAAGRAPVLAGIGDNCIASSVEAAQAYLAAGAGALVALLPSFYPLRAAAMRDYFALLASRIHGDILLYNIPQTTHVSLPVEVVESLATLPNIIGFKDSENSPGRPEQAAACLAGRPDFSLFMGSAPLGSKAMRLGFDGVVPSSGNADPALWARFWAAAARGDWDQVEAMQLRQNAVAACFQRDRNLGESLAALKAILECQGLCTRTMLPPLQALDAEAFARLRAELPALGLL